MCDPIGVADKGYLIGHTREAAHRSRPITAIHPITLLHHTILCYVESPLSDGSGRSFLVPGGCPPSPFLIRPPLLFTSPSLLSPPPLLSLQCLQSTTSSSSEGVPLAVSSPHVFPKLSHTNKSSSLKPENGPLHTPTSPSQDTICNS